VRCPLFASVEERPRFRLDQGGLLFIASEITNVVERLEEREDEELHFVTVFGLKYVAAGKAGDLSAPRWNALPKQRLLAGAASQLVSAERSQGPQPSKQQHVCPS
jgi:hypothetical protein